MTLLNGRLTRQRVPGADENYEEVIYEGYGPGGVAVLVYCLTENRNRTAPNVRVAFNKNGGSLGESGSVGYMFDRKGRLFIERTDSTDEDTVMMAALEAGADDIESTEEGFEIVTQPSDFLTVKEALEAEGIVFISAEIEMIPSMYTELSADNEELFDKMIDIWKMTTMCRTSIIMRVKSGRISGHIA